MILPREKFTEIEFEGCVQQLRQAIETVGAYLYSGDYVAAKQQIETAFDLIEEMKRDLIALERHIDCAPVVAR